MKNIIIIIISIFFIGSSVFSYIQTKTIDNKYKALLESTGLMRTQNTLLKEGFFHSYDFSDLQFDFSRKVQNFQLDSLSYKEVLSGKNTLILFIHAQSCTSCNRDNLEDFGFRLIDDSFHGFSVNPIVYCVIDTSLNMKYFFAPSVSYPDLTIEYFNKLFYLGLTDTTI